MSRNHNYVDNNILYDELKNWRECLEYNPNAVMPRYVAESIVKIANHLSRRYNFSGYTSTWRDEMIGDAIEHCLRYLKNFDHEKFNNPHSYITQICFRAFVQRLKKEKRQTATKYKFFVTYAQDYENEEGEHRIDQDFYQQMVDRLDEYEKTIEEIPELEELTKKDVKLEELPLGAFYG